jgi:hypothetical protein
MPALHLAMFRCDVTPPAGHPLCGGWIEPVRGVFRGGLRADGGPGRPGSEETLQKAMASLLKPR